MIFSLDEFPLQNLPGEGMVVYVCSTTGQGEEPDNMQVCNPFKCCLHSKVSILVIIVCYVVYYSSVAIITMQPLNKGF